MFKQIKKLFKNVVIQNTGIYTLGNMLPQLINVLLLPVFTRYLSKEEYGILSYTTSLNVFFLVIGTLSVHSYVLRNYFECSGEKEKQQLFGTVSVFLIIYNLLLLGIAVNFFPIFFKYFGVQIPFDPYIRLALFINAADVTGVVPLAYFRVKQKAIPFVLLTFLQILIGTGLSLYLVIHLKMGVLGRYYGLLGAGLVMLVSYFIIIWKISSLRPDMNLLKKSLVFSLPLCPTAFFTTVMNMSDRLILERYVSLSEIGIYSIGFMVANGLSILTNGIYKATEPEIYRMADKPGFKQWMLNLKRYMVFIMLGIGCPLIILSKEIIMLLTAPNFHESFKITSLITVGMIIRGITMPVSCCLMANYATRYLPLITLTGALTSIGINFILIPQIGIYGAGISIIISSTVMLILSLFAARLVSGIHFHFGIDGIIISGACFLAYELSKLDFFNLKVTIISKLIIVAVMFGMTIWYMIYHSKKENILCENI